MQFASIAMYLTPQPLADATAKLWSFLRHYLSQAGLTDLPETLDRTLPYDEAWLRSDLLLSQTCGYPFASRLRGKVRLVATPVYDHPGCDGPLMRSFIIVRTGSSLRTLEDLRGTTAAINSPDSNSGSNLFRAAVAPRAREGRFFGRIIETGSHSNSIAAVVEGRADSAAIDCITYGNIRRFNPGHGLHLRRQHRARIALASGEKQQDVALKLCHLFRAEDDGLYVHAAVGIEFDEVQAAMWAMTLLAIAILSSPIRSARNALPASGRTMK